VSLDNVFIVMSESEALGCRDRAHEIKMVFTIQINLGNHAIAELGGEWGKR
jgi:hypothetical protein